MSEPGKAVFLSYASQDAEAAKRICDALRAVGVEVWFDAEGGLEHGDEWDAKIRRQIKECVLFIPLISENTQAREEGYFRIEWELAAQRALGIASGVAFILPVVVDGTKEPDALVPDRFRSVQWTKLPGGDVPPEVLQRFLKLWSHRTGALKQQAAGAERGADTSAPMARGDAIPVPGWKFYAGIAVVCLGIAAGAIAWFSRQEAVPKQPRAAGLARAPISEARQLVTRARALIDDDLMAVRENFRLADEFSRRAVALDATDGEVWATAARVSALILRAKYEMTPERRETAKTQVERAGRLAPDSIETGLALATYLEVNNDPGEAERLLRRLIQQAPADKRLWQSLAVNLANDGRYEEALATLRQPAGLLEEDPQAQSLVAYVLSHLGRYREEEAVLERVLQRSPTKMAYYYQLVMVAFYRAELAAASRLLEKIPPQLMQEDSMINSAAEIWLRLGEGEKTLQVLKKSPRDFLEEGFEVRPKGFLTGAALQLLGRPTAAAAEWRQALVVVENRLAGNPNQPLLLYWKGLLQALTGQKAAALETRKLYRELEARPNAWFDAILLVAAGENEQAIQGLERAWPTAPVAIRGEIRGELLYGPWLAAIRADLRMQRLVAEHTAAIERDRAGPIATSAKTDDKSVAVLPFANLSGDVTQEYFSDGLTEEILNALARERDLRVPGRASSFSFKGRNVSAVEIAKALNVSRLVEGSVRRSGNKVRISVSLTRAGDGFSEELGTFTEEVTDIFALQEKVASAVVAKLTNRTAGLSVAAATSNPEAYDAYLRGRTLQTRSFDGLRPAADLYRRAVELDPGFALAWVRMAECKFRAFTAANDRSPELVSTVNEAIARALAIDPKLPYALIMRANVRRETGDVDGAARDLAEAEKAVPNSGELMLSRAFLARRTGDWTATFRGLEEFLRQDPNNGDYLQAIGRLYDTRGRFAEADRLFARAVLLGDNGVRFSQIVTRGNWRGAEAALQFFGKLSADEADRNQNLKVGLLIVAGRRSEARALAVRIEEAAADKTSTGAGQSPRVSPVLLKLLGLPELAEKRARELKVSAEKELDRGNRAPNILISRLASCEWVLGNLAGVKSALEETEAVLRQAGDRHRYLTEYAAEAVFWYAAMGEREKALAALDQYLAAGYHFGYVLEQSFRLESLRGDPRFEAMVASEVAWAKAQPDPID